MGAHRALIIGSDKDYCYVVKEFLESKGLIVSLILDYNYGIDKLFYENPDITILELISPHKISTNLLGKVRSSLDIQVIDDFNKPDLSRDLDKKDVFILQDTSQLNTLLAYLNTFLINNYQQAKTIVATSDSADNSHNLKSYPYPVLLSYIYRNHISCVLDIMSKVKLKVYFENGIPVFAEAGDVETALGRMLIDSGKLKDTTEYEKILDKVTEKGLLLGEVLVSMELISPHDLNNMLEKQIMEKLIRGFDLSDGEFKLSQPEDYLEKIVKYKVGFHQLLNEGIKRYIKPDLLKYVFYKGDIARKIVMDESIHLKSQNIGLGPKELRIIQDLEKNSDLEKLLKNSTAGKEEILRLLFLIYLMGILKIENGPYSNIDKVFSDIEVNSNNDAMHEVENIIDLEEEIPSDIKHTSGKETGRKINARLLDDLGKRELTTDMQLPDDSGKSNVIPFKDQHVSIEDMQSEQDEKQNDQADAQIKDSRKNSIQNKELLEKFYTLFDDVEQKTHYEILGISKDSDVNEIKSAYYDLVKKYHPDILTSIDRDISERADTVFAKITVAYQILMDENQRAQYDATFELEKLKSQAGVLYQAETEYNEGLAFLKQKQYDLAIEKFNKAKEINPENYSYSTLISWANFLKNRDDMDTINKSISAIEYDITQDPTNPESYYYLGSIYKHINELRKAEINFSKAVEHDPDFVEAKRELRVIKNRKAETKDSKNLKTEKRFWSGIFKK